jgi:hypothetical protein
MLWPFVGVTASGSAMAGDSYRDRPRNGRITRTNPPANARMDTTAAIASWRLACDDSEAPWPPPRSAANVGVGSAVAVWAAGGRLERSGYSSRSSPADGACSPA